VLHLLAANLDEQAAPALLIGDLVVILADVLRLLCANTQRFIPGRSRPLPVQHVKPHPSAVYKA
jgi:hypothetical protein